MNEKSPKKKDKIEWMNEYGEAYLILTLTTNYWCCVLMVIKMRFNFNFSFSFIVNCIRTFMLTKCFYSFKIGGFLNFRIASQTVFYDVHLIYVIALMPKCNRWLMMILLSVDTKKKQILHLFTCFFLSPS